LSLFGWRNQLKDSKCRSLDSRFLDLGKGNSNLSTQTAYSHIKICQMTKRIETIGFQAIRSIGDAFVLSIF
jgi:hypothetical protein